MLSDADIDTLFREFLPEDVTIVHDDLNTYITQALSHPFIQMQMTVGIYDKQNIYTDFMGPARAHSSQMRQVICTQVFNQLLEGVPEEIAKDYVRYVAAHEAHHFHADHAPVTAKDHAISEKQCVEQTEADYPELARAAEYVETEGPVGKRVRARLAAIKRSA